MDLQSAPHLWENELIVPSRFDLYISSHLAFLLGKHPFCDKLVQEFIVIGLFGGLFFAASIFACWSLSQREVKFHGKAAFLESW
jgi:hypothetical protein